MTWPRLARLLLRVLAVIVLAASGAYLLIYLYRWEWNRALISGIFFVAAEVALGSASMSRRMSRLEQRIDRLDRPAADRGSPPDDEPPDPPASSLTADAGEAGGRTGGPFPWLEPGSLSVFVPVLLGVGAMLTGIAYLIERVARYTDPDAAQTAVGRRLADLQPPSSLIPLGGRTAEDRSEPGARRGRRREPGSRVTVAVTLAVVTLFVWTLVVVLAELTENEPDPVGMGGRSSFDLVVEFRGETAPALPVAQALLTTCRPMASPWSTVELSPLGGSRVRLVVTPSLAENAERRFTGCLTDLQLDRILVHLDVLSPDQEGAYTPS